MRRIEIDADVWQVLQQAAQPLVDSPNTVLRRLLGLEQPQKKTEGHAMPMRGSTWAKREPRKHHLASKKYSMGHQEIWWYGIPPIGKKYQPSDRINFVLNEFRGTKSGQLEIELAGRFLQRIHRAAKDNKGCTHVKIVRQSGHPTTMMYFGRKVSDDEPEVVTVREV
jgi:hypothetical protein